jgi:hypothetical protein
MTQVEVGSREWQELVSETRTAASTSAWVVGDNALRVELHHLGEFAEEVEVSYDTVKRRRWVASRWPSVNRFTETSFKVHDVLASRPDRFDLIKAGMTVKEAKAKIGQSIVDRGGAPVPTLISVIHEITEVKRRLRAAFRVTVSMDPSENDKQLILSDLADVEEVAEEFRLFLLGEGVDDTIRKIMEEV